MNSIPQARVPASVRLEARKLQQRFEARCNGGSWHVWDSVAGRSVTAGLKLKAHRAEAIADDLNRREAQKTQEGGAS